MTVHRFIRICFLAGAFADLCQPRFALSQTATSRTGEQAIVADRDGQHDFDFNLGTWRTHIRRLQHPFEGSNTWVELNGSVLVRSLWEGRAQLEEIEAHGPTGHFEGLTLFLYNPQSHQWSQRFANSNEGVLGQPAIGEFKNGRGEFFDQEMFNGRAILVRAVWSDIRPNSHRFEQAFSSDGGRTWETNFIATLTREVATSAQWQSFMDPGTDDQHNFDFNFGIWKTHVSRLQRPLTNSNVWLEYAGISRVDRVWRGRANLLELEVKGNNGCIEGLGLRLYNPKSRQWSLNWANSSDGVMTRPMIGEFKDGRGDFYDQELFNGKAILVRNGFSQITSKSSRFEQAFSEDGGRTWESNWVMTFSHARLPLTQISSCP